MAGREIGFFKMHGAANDYVYLDCIAAEPPPDEEIGDLARAMADRHTGVGGDGLVLILAGDVAPVRMRMFNADGSEAEMCGNAVRCVGRYAADRGYATGDRFPVETALGAVTIERIDTDRFRVDMGEPHLIDNTGTFDPVSAPTEQTLQTTDGAIRYWPISMGNPHAVQIVDAFPLDLHRRGDEIEHHTRFPHRTNVEFAVVRDRGHLDLRVWERGAGETMACGTGACATAVATVLAGRTDRLVEVSLPGGTLAIEWASTDNHVFMTGPTAYVFSGTFTSRAPVEP